MVKIRITRIILIVFLLFVKNLSIIAIVLSSGTIQSYITKKTIEYFANRYEINLNIEKVYIKLPNKVAFGEVTIWDEKGDTLLFASEFNSKISALKYFENKLYIDQINIVNPILNIDIDTCGTANYEYIIKKFESTDDKEKKDRDGFDIFCNRFNLINAVANYKNHMVEGGNEVFDASNISISDFNVIISEIMYHSDTLEFELNKFQLLERSGFAMHEMSAYVKLHDLGISIKDFILETNNSRVVCPQILLSGTERGYLSDPINKLQLNLMLDSSYFDLADLGFFIPGYLKDYNKIYVSGNFNGNISRIRLNNFSLNYGVNTSLLANLSLDGLPNLDFTFIFGEIRHFSTTPHDIERLTLALSQNKPINLPDIVFDLGDISFEGNVTGLFNDAVAYGKFTTDIGVISTDIALASDFDDGMFRYSGHVNVDNLNIGKIIDNQQNFGLVTMETKLRGNIDSVGNFSTTIDCDISKIEMFDYKYSGIKLTGSASNNYMIGDLKIEDSNIKLSINGFYDNRKKYPIIKFESDFWANLNEIKIIRDTLKSEIELSSFVDLSGDLASMPEGEIILNKFIYRQDKDSIHLNNFELKSFYGDNLRQFLTLRSDFIDIDFDGKYKFTELIEKLSGLIYNYFPSIAEDDSHEFITDNKANFNINIKNINEITNLFIPKLRTEDNIIISGNINTLNNAVNAEVSMPFIVYDSVYLSENKINFQTYYDSIDISLNISSINWNDFDWFENVDLSVNIFKDSIFTMLFWDNHDTIRNFGDIRFSSIFEQRDSHSTPLISNYLNDSYVTFQNRDWILNKAPIIIDTSNIHIERFRIEHENQNLFIDGYISEDPSKRLRFLINEVNLANFNPYIAESGYYLDGILSGNGRAANLYGTPSLRTSLSIQDFKINDEDFGRFDISGNYNSETGGFTVDGTNKYMRLRGNYNPESDLINLTVNSENFNLEVLQPYLYDFDLSEIKGSVNIFVSVQGELKDPQIDGYIDFNQTQFQYDFLKARIFTNDRITITSNSIDFNNFVIRDEFNNAGTIRGAIYHDKFSEMFFDIDIRTNNMKVLNTTEVDNSWYYGKVFASGNARIHGDIFNFGIDVTGKTEPRTVFVLPMTESYQSRDIGFVTFIQKSSDEDTVQRLEALSSRMQYYFRMDVEVTPDAEAQIVFDPTVGDLIRGNCRGNIKMEYTSDEEFYMYGELEVVEGDYLFTLQNVINKRFHIVPGGTLIWDGDPYEAQIDLYATYNLRAPLIDLMRAYQDTSEVYRRPTQVECKMKMTGNLMNPDIQFSINVPHADEKARAQLANMSQDDINKQMLYLLILNRFYSPMDMRDDFTTTTNPFGVTSSELLSNQLSNWLSQISRDFDIGFNYRPGTEVSGQELEVALSTQILNDRVLINGNVGYGDNITTAATSNLVGDVEVQLKVNPSGSFRLKGFTRANDELSTELGPYTTGMGVFYTQDFNTFGELFERFYNAITFKNRREKRKNK